MGIQEKTTYKSEGFVCIHEDKLVITDEKDTTQYMLLQDIETIEILTTDMGPWINDVWWLITGKDTIFEIAGDAMGIHNMLDTFHTFEKFNHEEVIKAMQCTDYEVFTCWNKN